MATADTITPDGVGIDELPWGNLYRGTAEALIAAGLVRLDQLPGQPGRGRTTTAYFADGTMSTLGRGRKPPDGPGCMLIRKTSARRYSVYIDADEAEIERRRVQYEKGRQRRQQEHTAQLERERNREAAAKAGMSEREFALKDFCRDEADFRQRAVGSADAAKYLMRGLLMDGGIARGGFRFDEATKRRHAMLMSAVDDLLRTGTVIFDQEKCDQEERKALAAAGLDGSVREEPRRPAPLLRVVK